MEIWVLVFFCYSLVHCDTGTGAVSATIFETEQQCQQAGLKLLHQGGRGMFGRAALCIKGVK